MSPSFPMVSVVTVVRNDPQGLERTIKSTRDLANPAIEYIVIDGASTDGTLELIRRNETAIDRWISEPDDGIYDAMNKGAALATGDWIVFMNAGDTFSSPEALSNLGNELRGGYDVILAGCEKILDDEYERRRFRCAPGPISDLWKGMPTSHQAVLIRRSTQQEFGFDTRFQWCADHDLLTRLQLAGKSFARTDSVMCFFDCAGGRTRDPMLYIHERWRISKALAPALPRCLHFGREWLHCRIWGPVTNVVRRALPRALVLKLRHVRGTAGS